MKATRKTKKLKAFCDDLPASVLRFFPRATSMGMPDRVIWKRQVHEGKSTPPTKKSA